MCNSHVGLKNFGTVEPAELRAIEALILRWLPAKKRLVASSADAPKHRGLGEHDASPKTPEPNKKYYLGRARNIAVKWESSHSDEKQAGETNEIHSSIIHLSRQANASSQQTPVNGTSAGWHAVIIKF